MSHFLHKRKGFQNERWNKLKQKVIKRKLYRIVNNIKTTLTNRFPYSILPIPKPQDQDRLRPDRHSFSIPVTEQLCWPHKHSLLHARVLRSLPQVLPSGKSNCGFGNPNSRGGRLTALMWHSKPLWSPLQGETLGPADDWLHLWGALRLVQGPGQICPNKPRTWNHWY